MSNLSKPSIFAIGAVVATLICATACVTEKPALRERAKPAGRGLFVVAPETKVVAGTSCGDSVVEGISDRFKSATAGALSNAGFGVVSDEKAPMSAKVELTIDYCSDAGVVSGSTALSLERTGKGMVWRGQVTGDQARGETAASTMNELVEKMLWDDNVIRALGDPK